MACSRLTYASRRRNGAHVRVRCTRPGSRARQAGHLDRGGATAYPRAKRPGVRPPTARSQPGRTHNIPFCTLRLTAAESAAAEHIGYVRASSSNGGSGALWAQRIAGGATARPLPAAASMGSGPGTEGPLDLSWRG
jgi:hypothetical protein